MALAAALGGSMIVAGLVAVVAGLRGWAPAVDDAGSLRRSVGSVGQRFAALCRVDRLGWAAAGAVLAFVVTGWPVAAVIGGVGAWVAATALGRRADDAAARAEATALWAEILRDALGTSWEIETVLKATAPTAPRLIRADVMAATDRLAYESFDGVLDDLGARLGGGTGDLVIAALRLAGRSGGRQVREILDSVAAAAYHEAEMLQRIEVARQSPRTSARLVTAITVLSMAGTAVFFRDWVAPYGSATGQVALALIAGWCGLALAWMARMSRVDVPARFAAGRGADR
jgi:tight adherence protein B